MAAQVLSKPAVQWGLTGLSLAAPAIGALNGNKDDPTREPGANLAGGVGAVGLGLAGAGLGRAAFRGGRMRDQAMRFAAIPAGAFLGGTIGSNLASGAYSGVRGLFKDPFSDYISQTERLAESQARAQANQMDTLLAPMYRQGLAAGVLTARQNMRDAQLAALLNYQQGAMAAALGSPGVYNNPGFSQSLSQLAGGALG